MQGFLIVAPIVILMLLGATLRKTGFLVETDVKCLAKLVYWVISPAILFRGAMRLEMNWASQLNYIAAIYSAAIAVAFLVYLFGRFVLRNAGTTVLPVSVFASFRCNSIMVGIPVVMLSMGEAGVIPIAIYFAVTEVGYGVLTAVSAELSRGNGSNFKEMMAQSFKGVMKTPMVWASLSGLLISATGYHTLPGSLDKAFSLIGEMATGASILMIGASLNIGKIRKNFFALLPDCAVRLFVHPAILLFFFKIFPAPPEIVCSAVIITAVPAPNIAFVYSQAVGLDSEYAAGLIGFTTILFGFTMPFWLNLLGVV